jgi:hypothetical protein
VYVGVRLYSKKVRETNSRSETETKPSRVIFIDDAPAAPSCPTAPVCAPLSTAGTPTTSAIEPVTKDDVRRAAAALGGDPSGVDLTQLVRVPGTLNTKNGERFTIEV